MNAIDILFGDKNEEMTITLNKDKFVSTEGFPLTKNTVKGHPYQIVPSDEFLSAAESSTGPIVGLVVGAMISSNVLL